MAAWWPAALLVAVIVAEVTLVIGGQDEALKATLHGYTGYGLADAWAGFIWNRFPAEIYPLFLSPLIEAGRAAEGREMSRVQQLTGDDVESYSGFITVNKHYDSNLFFWFFPAERNASEAPVLLWLNGGPGRTSMVGALMENGPYQITKTGRLEKRNASWTRHFSMLYVDNPVGTGYSFTRNWEAGKSSTMEDVSENLYSLLIQFFKLFPLYSKNDFYIGGQSYAGKYIPALGYYIHQRNHDDSQSPELFLPFKGIYLGAGFCDPPRMLAVFPDYLYFSGLISNDFRQKLIKNFTQLIQKGLAVNPPDKHRVNYARDFFAIVGRQTGIRSADHLLGFEASNSPLFDAFYTFLWSAGTRLKLHTGLRSGTTPRGGVMQAFSASGEFLSSTSPQNAFLMDRYKVLHYSGNLDIVVNVPMTEAFLSGVQWSGQRQYAVSDRKIWWVKGQLAGWVTTVGNFTRVIVRNSGHMVPYDKPEWALEMMRNFVFGKSFVKDFT